MHFIRLLVIGGRDQDISRFRSLDTSSGLDCKSLEDHGKFPKGRILWIDESTKKSGSFNSIKHCGGMWTRNLQGWFQFLIQRAWVAI
jgi:hypothetical protein